MLYFQRLDHFSYQVSISSMEGKLSEDGEPMGIYAQPLPRLLGCVNRALCVWGEACDAVVATCELCPLGVCLRPPPPPTAEVSPLGRVGPLNPDPVSSILFWILYLSLKARLSYHLIFILGAFRFYDQNHIYLIKTNWVCAVSYILEQLW